MTSLRFDWRTDEGILLHVEAEVDEYGEFQEWVAILKQGGNDITFNDYLTGPQQDDITQAAWDEYTQYLDDRRVRV